MLMCTTNAPYEHRWLLCTYKYPGNIPTLLTYSVPSPVSWMLLILLCAVLSLAGIVAKKSISSVFDESRKTKIAQSKARRS